mmetsp:Transcript_23846/g.27147  ORF Transcript_23846/g.27147 Transcript_23846/m.27147 type:complete len:855 (-) Transcript_23846:39-2603(-)
MSSFSNSNGHASASRHALKSARRICIKAGTSVVAKEDGRPSLTRLGAIAEQIGELVRDRNIEVVFVSSGAVGMGKRVLKKQSQTNLTRRQLREQREFDNYSPASLPKSTMTDFDAPLFPSTTASLLLDEENNNDDSSSSMGGLSRSRVLSSKSFVSLLELNTRPTTAEEKRKVYDSACAAAGQFDMMNLYSSLFQQEDVVASQILVTQTDFLEAGRTSNLKYAVERLMKSGIVPIVNENDAVSANKGYTEDNVFSDNDSLAALCARAFDCDVLLLLTDVDGIYDKSPKEYPESANLLPLYTLTDNMEEGAKSSQGRGGMGSKLQAARTAVTPGSKCRACVIASGTNLTSIRDIFANPNTTDWAGTLLCTPNSALEREALKEQQQQNKEEAVQTTTMPTDNQIKNNNEDDETRRKAVAARNEARKLASMPYSVRQTILRSIATSLEVCQEDILSENAKDVKAASEQNVSDVLQKRLKLTPSKLTTLASGLRQIASLPDPLHKVLCRRELSSGLMLEQVTVPIGVLLIIFESRPDSMPQIAALSLATGNGLLLKGGKEAVHSNAAIHRVIGDAIEQCPGKIKRDIIGLITSRNEVKDLLDCDDVIDLVIPRGGNSLVSYIHNNTRIPVLGHADGVCHVYVDSSASKMDTADVSRLIVDAKTNYPSACNAMETLLLHRDMLVSGEALSILMSLRAAGVRCLGGPTAMTSGLCDTPATEPFRHEYGDLSCTVQVVDSIDDAVDWIHKHGSGHTECIVASDPQTAQKFLTDVDAACVFWNASTRFADGYRFGLGAEVGISTGRIHARGPVGVDGLLTTKYKLVSTANDLHCVNDYNENNEHSNPPRTYTHVDKPTTTSK